jgi:cytochrome c553
MFTGHLSEDEMLDEHPLELADIKAGTAERPVDARAVARRRRIFLPIYGILAALLLAGVFAFVTFEQTAITTLPEPVEIPIFVPLTATSFPTGVPSPTRAPSATPQPTGATALGTSQPSPAATEVAAAGRTWTNDVGPALLAACGGCHGAGGGMAGLDLTSNAGALAGGSSGPAVVPGDAAASLLVQRQQSGDHPGQLEPEVLAWIIEWIGAGAPE